MYWEAMSITPHSAISQATTVADPNSTFTTSAPVPASSAVAATV